MAKPKSKIPSVSHPTTSGESIEILIPPSMESHRLDVALSSLHENLSRSRIQDLIQGDGIAQVAEGNKKVVVTKASQRVKAGERYEITIPPIQKLELNPIDLGLSLVYEDDHLAIVNKPAGLSVHASDTESGPTLVHGLLHQLKSLSGIGGIERPGIVHRIDKGTSGLLVVTKTDEAHKGLSLLFAEHRIQREYWALVQGNIETKWGPTTTIHTQFGRHPTDRKKMTGKISQGRAAITHVRKLKSNQFISWVQCKLETGRTHQIRVHLSEAGFPLLGDPVYGWSKSRSSFLRRWSQTMESHFPGSTAFLDQLDHQLLHARTLGFVHPITQKELHFSSDPPEDFQKALGFFEEPS